MSCCDSCTGDKPAIVEWGELIEATDLSSLHKKAIRVRVLSVIGRLKERLKRLTVTYTMLRTSTTVGSLLVPSLLAVQTNIDQSGAYWAMWGIGLVVSLSNAFVSLFRIDKNYFTVGDLVEKIESEAWMYLTLSGKYKHEDYESGLSGHQLMFTQFMERCELLMSKAITTEYISGSIPPSNRSVIQDQPAMYKAAAVHPPLVNSRDKIPDPYSYETVALPVDDKHDSSDHNSTNSSDNVRREHSDSDSSIEVEQVSGGGGVHRE